MNKEEKVEASVPIQARVNIVSLANLDKYWRNESYYIKTMSQLVNWSIDLLIEVLSKNNMLVDEVKGVSEAYRYLEERGLFQRGMKKRSMQKLGTAISFENLRNEGVDPKAYIAHQYNVVHNKSSVDPLKVEVGYNDYNPVGIVVSDKEIERTKKLIEEHRNKGNRRAKSMTMEEVREETLKAAERSGVFGEVGEVKEGMTDEELREKMKEDIVKLKEEERANEEFLNSLKKSTDLK